MSEPFGRQPGPVTVVILADDPLDQDQTFRGFMRFARRNGDDTQDLGPLLGGRAFRIYPRAVND